MKSSPAATAERRKVRLASVSVSRFVPRPIRVTSRSPSLALRGVAMRPLYPPARRRRRRAVVRRRRATRRRGRAAGRGAAGERRLGERQGAREGVRLRPGQLAQQAAQAAPKERLGGAEDPLPGGRERERLAPAVLGDRLAL